VGLNPQESYLSDVGLNPPPQSQHNEGVGGCNEGKPKAAIKAEFPTKMFKK